MSEISTPHMILAAKDMIGKSVELENGVSFCSSRHPCELCLVSLALQRMPLFSQSHTNCFNGITFPALKFSTARTVTCLACFSFQPVQLFSPLLLGWNPGSQA